MQSNKYPVGMYGGSFDPLHTGHLNNIYKAAAMCERLYVMISYSRERDYIPMEMRYRWILDSVKHLNNVEIITVEDESTSKDEYDENDWKKGAQKVKDIISDMIDVVFCGTDYSDRDIFERLYPESEVIYFDRNIIPITSTEIRENPYRHWQFIPDICRPYFCKKVLIVGIESTGKSTLVKHLAKMYRTNYVHEVGRLRCEEAGREEFMNFDDMVYNMICQKREELEAIKKSNKVLFVDTDVVTTEYYSNFLLTDTSERNRLSRLSDAISNINDWDLVVYLEPTVEFVQDGTRNEDMKIRKDIYNNQLKTLLDNRGIEYYTLSGDYLDRYNSAIDLIDRKLNIKLYY